MNNHERDDYDIFLDNWKPSELLEHVTLPPYLHDPVTQERLHGDSTGMANVIRTPFVIGPKLMVEEEDKKRKYDFFKKHQADWSAEFQERVLAGGVNAENLKVFIGKFATQWSDGKKLRQDSSEMMSIKASIQHHDQKYYAKHAGLYVLTPVPNEVVPLFDDWEMKAIFKANEDLLETIMPDYLEELAGVSSGSINNLYVRRGVCMPAAPGVLRKELNYLSSYSFSLTPVEQFAQTWTTATKSTGIASIFSAPIPALQMRVVAFAPFIEGMDLSQLELVVAPPIAPSKLRQLGVHGGIYEFEFD